MRLLAARSLFPLIALSAVPLAQAQTAISSTFDLSVFADADTADGIDATDSFSDSQGATLSSYSGTVTATDTLASGSGAVTGTSSATVSWTDAGHGSLLIRDHGWDMTHPDEAYVALDTTNTALPVWSYQFMATSDGTFTLDYDVSATGDKFGLDGFVMKWSGPGGDGVVFNAVDPTATGSFVRSLTNGVIYTVSINVGSGILVGGSNGRSGRMSADIDFKIESVPEPATLGVLALGLVRLLKRKKN
ncbi:PEP-CTERM sorting domain-containing protein [bacterium]|nr:MAG: PEP-CTERM sorting domain-containing protein [bacterium]